MRRPILLLALVAAMLAVASGAALALTRDCEPFRDCFGSNRSDTMRGSRGTDFMFGLAGNDTMKGNGRWDQIEGGKGADKVYGMRGGDDTLWGGHGGGCSPTPPRTTATPAATTSTAATGPILFWAAWRKGVWIASLEGKAMTASVPSRGVSFQADTRWW